MISLRPKLDRNQCFDDWLVLEMNFFVSFFFCAISTLLLSQQLVINEISQGSGSNEYVEFVVMGNPNCSSNPPCVDLRGVVLDDNNGEFAPGPGTGIAQGAIRFSQDIFWSCVPQGTIIVVYSELNPNPLLPPDDLSLSDGNCLVVMAANSNLIEGQAIQPTTSLATYPSSASWIAGAGSWNTVAMANSSDAFQIRPNILSATSSHAITWGNNSGGAAQFANATGAVFSMMNTTDNNPMNGANWIQGAITTNETPGAPNSLENAAWIGSMNPNCSAIGGITATITPYASPCGITCQGAASVDITGGLAPYQILWSTNATTDSVSNLCAGFISVQITDALGCSVTSSAAINQQTAPTGNALYSNESCDGSCDGNIILSGSGGQGPYTFDWDNGMTGNNVDNLCPGTYTIFVIDQNNCSDTVMVTIEVGNPIPVASVSNFGTHSITSGAVVLSGSPAGGSFSSSSCPNCIVSGNQFDPNVSGIGTFDICYTVIQAGCSDSACSTITIFAPCSDIQSNVSHSLCVEDSVFIENTWFSQPGIYMETISLSNGCDSIITHQLTACVDSSFYLEIPTIFTPNGDETNDYFTPKYIGLNFWEMTIFNRWGEKITDLNEQQKTWDGNSDGKPCSEGVYFYTMNYDALNGQSTTIHGFFHLSR